MTDQWSQSVVNTSLSQSDFNRIARFIHENYAIKMPEAKKTLVESRLRRRLQQTGYTNIRDYLDYVFSPEGEQKEMVHMVDCLTTNKTFFFREPDHFDTLCKLILPRILQQKAARREDPTIRIWSSACSTGEEPYTIAMVVNEFALEHGRFPFSIMASDLCTKVLKVASRGVYREDQIEEIPPMFRSKYLLRSKDRSLGLVKILDSLRSRISFLRINLKDDFPPIDEPLNIIFCRNVMIYFNKDDQQELMHRFYEVLAPGGFILVGHSESLTGLNTPFTLFRPTIYQRLEGR